MLCVSLPSCYPDRCMFADCTACTCSLSGKWGSESASLLVLLPVSYLWPRIMLDTWASPQWITACSSLPGATQILRLQALLCALGLNFCPIPVVDFMLIVKQVVSITFLLICLPGIYNIEILSEASLHCPTLLPDISTCIWHNLIKVSPNWLCPWIKWILHLFKKKKINK